MRNKVCIGFITAFIYLSRISADAEQCVPNCQGKECGDDGCGGSCGECAANKDCVLGHCVYGCGSIGGRGCCYGDYLLRCEYSKNKLWVHNCAERGLTCGWDAGALFYGCVPPPGLPDPEGEYPMECDFNCYPYCPKEYECGNDGCGGVCGECEPGQVCAQRKCCTPSCEGKECGSDGCLGWCGDCPEGFWCTDFYRCAYGYGCVPTKTPGCKSCACLRCVCDMDPYCCEVEWDARCSYICDNYCGGCLPCPETCGDKECGPDGCGWVCGTCPEGKICQDGYCVDVSEPDFGGQKDVIEAVEVTEARDVVEERQRDYVEGMWEEIDAQQSEPREDLQGDRVVRDAREEEQKDPSVSEDKGTKPEEDTTGAENAKKGGGCSSNPLPQRFELLFLLLVLGFLALSVGKRGVK